MTPDQELLRDAFLAECWAPVRELPRDVRAGLAAVAAIRSADLDEHAALPEPIRRAS